MTFEPFLIAPYSVGIDTDLAPWLLPEDAFVEIDNAHIKHKRIEKRSGFRKMAQIYETDANWAISAITTTDPGIVTVISTAGIVAGNQIIIQYVTGMTEINGLLLTAGTVTPTTIELLDAQGNNLNTSGFTPYLGAGYVSLVQTDRIMGIGRAYNSSGLKDTYVWSATRGFYLQKNTSTLSPLDTADILSGDKTQFIHWSDWNSVQSSAAAGLNRIYFTNGKAFSANLDGIRFYNASNPTGSPTGPIPETDSRFRPTKNGGVTINGCKFIFAIKQRLLLLGTYENSNFYPQRARWCKARSPGSPGAFSDFWDDNLPGKGGFVDCPTSEQIITARQLQNYIVVFFTNSVWTLRPTSDPRLPFRWDKINTFRGSDARAGGLEFDQFVMGISERGLTITDGNTTKRIDERIENFVTDDINEDEFGKVFMGRDYQERRTWILYSQNDVEAGTGENDHALILDDESGAFSKYEISMNCLGYGQRGFDLALDDFPENNNSLNPFHLYVNLNEAPDTDTLQSYHWDANKEIFIGGGTDGWIYELNAGLTDDGEPIEMNLLSAAWNPYKGQGIECELGYLDIYVDTQYDTQFLVQFYKNNSQSPYKSTLIDAFPDLRQISVVEDATPLNPATDGYLIKSASHGLLTGDRVYLQSINGPQFLNNEQITITKLSNDSFSIVSDFTGNGVNITAMTQANPCHVTAPNHNFVNGDFVIISGGDMVQVILNVYQIANVVPNEFDLLGVDSTGFDAYTDGLAYVFPAYISDGVVTELPFFQGKIWKRVHAGGIGYWHQVRIVESGSVNSFVIHGFMPHFRRTGTRMI